MDFVGKHNQKVVHGILDPFIQQLKDDGVTQFAGVGYCFGVSIYLCFPQWSLNAKKLTTLFGSSGSIRL